MYRSQIMQCPWCGDTLWQGTEAPDTTDAHVTGHCHHCGYRYEAKSDPVSGQIVTEITPGIPEKKLPDVEADTLGPPKELTKEHWEWICQEINDALKEDAIQQEIEEEDEEYWRTHPDYD